MCMRYEEFIIMTKDQGSTKGDELTIIITEVKEFAAKMEHMRSAFKNTKR